MPEFQGVECQTPSGMVMAYVTPTLRASERPVVVMLHGALRTASVFAPWVDLLADVAEVVLIDLPGHGRSDPIAPATVSAMADSLQAALLRLVHDRRVLLVGESIGGTIALALAGREDHGPIRAVLAADPPMTTSKQWTTWNGLHHAAAQAPDNPFIPRLGRDAFGFKIDGIEETIYYPLLRDLKVPTTIITGDTPLFPPRKLDRLASVFDDVDRHVLELMRGDTVRFQRIANCGHLVFTEAQVQCREIVTDLLTHI